MSSSRAAAYSDPASYELTIEEGGGAGRWFTGSPVDGYGCNVCHAASTQADIIVSGLPLESGYVPGQSYEVALQWPEAFEHLALVLEVTDERGLRAGTLELPREDATRPEEHCNREGLTEPAGSLLEAPSGRQFACVIDCGSRALRMLWTAPSVAAGPVWLSGGLVWSDDDASVAGDASFMIRKRLEVAGTEPHAEILSESAGCSTAVGSASGLRGLWVVVLGITVSVRRYGRRTRVGR